jgi:hypothetical protein
MVVAWNLGRFKFQTPNPKYQINFNLEFPMTQTILFRILTLGAYLEFACLPVGRVLEIWCFPE